MTPDRFHQTKAADLLSDQQAGSANHTVNFKETNGSKIQIEVSIVQRCRQTLIGEATMGPKIWFGDIIVSLDM